MRTFSAPSAWGSASPSEDARGAISATTQRNAISGARPILQNAMLRDDRGRVKYGDLVAYGVSPCHRKRL